ncbi:MFS transporter [Cyanobium sp. LEGE 06143]|nr:MFS transporter [Cyanobium sp. LEGE 06143]
MPSLPAMASDFRVSTATAEQSITAYVLGYGFSQLFWGPQADRFGRRPIALTGVPGSGSFLVLRLIQGVDAGYDTSVSRACLRDVLSQRSLAQAMSLAAISYALALGIAPFLGGWIASVASWRADFALMALLGSLVLAYLARALGGNLAPQGLPPDHTDPGAGRGGAGLRALASGPALSVASPDRHTRHRRGGWLCRNLSLALSGAYLLGSFGVRRTVVRLGQQRLLWTGVARITTWAMMMLLLGLAAASIPSHCWPRCCWRWLAAESSRRSAMPCRCRPSPPRRARPQPSPVSCSWKERPCSSARLSGCPTPPRCHWRSACSFLP